MNTMEVLTLLLVVFAALFYIDNHRKWQEGYSLPQIGDSLCLLLLFVII